MRTRSRDIIAIDGVNGGGEPEIPEPGQRITGLGLSRQEAADYLRDWLDDPAWRDVARPLLQKRLKRLAEQNATDTHASLETLRQRQQEYLLVMELIARPMAFFTGDWQDA